MGIFDKVKELAGDNKDILAELGGIEEKFSGLDSSNRDMTSKLEGLQRDLNDAIKRRDNATSAQRELEEKLETIELSSDSEKFQAEIDKMKGEYDSKLNEVTVERDKFKNDLVETRKQSTLANLNLAGKLPAEWTDEQKASAVKFMQFDLSEEGLTYDPEHNGFVFKADGVSRLNSETGKPYTVAEMAEHKIKSGAWSNYVQTKPTSEGGAGRGRTEDSGPTLKTINREGFEAMNQNQRHDYVQSGGKITD